MLKEPDLLSWSCGDVEIESFKPLSEMISCVVESSEPVFAVMSLL